MSETYKSPETSLTLLRMLGERNEFAWEEFAKRYTTFLRHWCEHWGVSSDETEDLIQETFLQVLARISHYRHRGTGSFRAWMKTVARRYWYEVIKQAERRKNVAVLENLRRSRLSLDNLESGIDLLIRQELLEIGMRTAKARVDQKTWEAFCLTTLEGLSGAEAAERLGMSVDAVYMAKCRVQRRITNELVRLDQSAEQPASFTSPDK